MTVNTIDPIQDPRWTALVNAHPDASVFHTVGWLRALQRTYGFQAIAYTTARAGAELKDGIAFCRVDSWLTGKRSISLPFSDHCQPLVDSAEALANLLCFISAERVRTHQKFVEIRPLQMNSSVLQATPSVESSQTFCLHSLNLLCSLEDIFKNFDKDCIQRKIRRAEKESLVYRSGQSTALLKDFYALQVGTRRRHGLPPQPFRWFSNLRDCLGEQLTIHTASKDGLPVAAMVIVKFKKTITYKYGCSNPRLNKLGGMPFLFWNVIKEAKTTGAIGFDLGRSDVENRGLIDFKNRLGAVTSQLVYYRDADIQRKSSLPNALFSHANHLLQKKILPHLPERFLMAAGRLMYKHVG